MRAKRLDLEKFFHDLEKWNRVVVKDTQHPSDEGSTDHPDPSPTAERRTFIRVSCDLESASPKSDAKLA